MNRESFPPDTYRVSQLGKELEEVLGEVFRLIWVGGEVQRPRRVRTGHLYFELVEKGSDDRVRAKLDAVLFRGDSLRVERKLRRAGVEVKDGQTLRMLGQLNFYPPHGRLQFLVRDIDIVSVIGALAQRREETLRWLQESNLLRRNAACQLGSVPLRVGLITSEGSAAYNDFMVVLRQSGYAFQVTLMHAAVQGASAESEVAAALRALSARQVSGRGEVDVVVLVRGGGSRADLAAFDGRDLAGEIARCPVPVLTGLGHEIDRSIADQVAHTASTTPTAVAELLAQRVSLAETRCEDLGRRLARQAEASLEAAKHGLDKAGQSLRRAELPLERHRHRLKELQSGLAGAGERFVLRWNERLSGLSRSLEKPSRQTVDSAAQRCSEIERAMARERDRVLALSEERLSSFERVFAQLDLARTLERGFSITRDGSGRAVRASEQVSSGDLLTTEVAAGRIVSRVEES